MNISQNHLERFLNICNTIADYENILVTDIRMEKMSDKIFVYYHFHLFVGTFWDIHNSLDKETTAKLSTYSKEVEINRQLSYFPTALGRARLRG